ncbi:MAG: 3-oxoacyl-[acyl-carrier protein] reductase [Archaeoglobi archaeon]|nr:3-oxoacyl-[acyl-carrier protein] reductase [Archaeoglobi archaeon]MDK2781548.1 3-oxoacyl-[acyl-carrier protein] reductase [Archaeoglobi archaeon]
MDLKDRVALVTGASRGIGRAIAVKLAEKGCRVAINYRRNEEEARKTLEEVKKFSDGILVKADVGKRDEVRKMVEEIVRTFGGIDILINNAGIVGWTRSIREISDEEWREVMRVNLDSMFIVTQEVLRFMKKGKIVNISSIAGRNGGTLGAHYAASKSGIIGFTFSLARELAPDILVSAVAPGPVETDIIDEETRKRLAELSLVKRVAKPEEVAHAVIFLLENDYMTGVVVDINAGRYMI